MVIWADRVREVTTAAFAGVGPVQLNGVPASPAGRVTFVAGVGSTNTCKFLIDDGAGGWELSEGTVTAGVPDTLSRDRVIKSSTGGAPVNFSAGVKDVVLVATSEEFTKVETSLQQGRHTIWIPASAIEPDFTAGPAFADLKINAGNNPTYKVLDFDQAVNEFAWINISWPKSWDHGGLSMRFWWTASIGTAGQTVAWEMCNISILDGETLGGGPIFCAPTVVDTLIATDVLHISPEIPFSIVGSTTTFGELTQTLINRKASNVNDTLAADARLIGVEFFLIINAGNDV